MPKNIYFFAEKYISVYIFEKMTKKGIKKNG